MDRVRVVSIRRPTPRQRLCVGARIFLSALATQFYINIGRGVNAASIQIASFMSPQSSVLPSHRPVPIMDGDNYRYRYLAATKGSSISALTSNHDETNDQTDDDAFSFSILEHAAPVYITIGPPCCGKTSALRSYLVSQGCNPNLVHNTDSGKRDVSLDDQSDVYHRIPLSSFIYPTTRLPDAIGSVLLRSGSTVKDRLLDPSFDSTDSELRSVILRLAGRITPELFAERVRGQALDAGDTVEYFRERRIAVAEDLIWAVEEVVVSAVGEVIVRVQMERDSAAAAAALAAAEEELPYGEEGDWKNETALLDLTTLNATSAHLLSARELIQTPHVDLFVPQAIFCSGGGIDRAKELLSTLIKSPEPVSWANTNTRPNQYVAALSAAEKAGRPVKFVAWGTGRLPPVSRGELIKANVARFRRTGRYIPAGAIGAALGRVECLVKEAELEAIKSLEDDEFPQGLQNDDDEEVWSNKMDSAFASLGGFRMEDGGLVVNVGEPKILRPPFRSKGKYKRLQKDSSNKDRKVGDNRRRK